MSDRGSRAPARDWYDLVIETIALRGWTKTELSERSGVVRPTIERWATGRRTPQAAPVNAVADILGIDRQRALRLAGVIAEPAAEAERSPPPRLREGTREAIRKDIEDPVLAEQVIAYVEGLATGRIRPASEAREADPPGDGQGRQRGRA